MEIKRERLGVSAFSKEFLETRHILQWLLIGKKFGKH